MAMSTPKNRPNKKKKKLEGRIIGMERTTKTHLVKTTGGGGPRGGWWKRITGKGSGKVESVKKRKTSRQQVLNKAEGGGRGRQMEGISPGKNKKQMCMK